MKRYFKGNEVELKKELDSWVGTPYRHWAGVKNQGVDCIHFVVRVLEKFKANQGINIIVPFYSKDWHLHRGIELLKTEIERQLFVEKIGFRDDNNYLRFTENIGCGDIVLFKFGRLSGHCGIIFGNQVYQTLVNSGVEKISFYNNDFMKRITNIYKVYKAK